MAFAVYYQLNDDDRDEDLTAQVEMFTELARRRPVWLSCASYQIDGQSRVLVIDVDDVAWLEALPGLSSYLTEIADRCQGEPRAGMVDPRDLSEVGQELGRWEPDQGVCSIPAAPPP